MRTLPVAHLKRTSLARVSRIVLKRMIPPRSLHVQACLRPRFLFHRTPVFSCNHIRYNATHVPHKSKLNTSFGESDSSQYQDYQLLTSNDLEHRTTPPRSVKMLVRDFIDDSLYNPNYGYFPKQATILNRPNETFDFEGMKDMPEFLEAIAKKYYEYGIDHQAGPGRQLWHTPTELFKPYYGKAVARCLASEYLLKYFPYEDFVIYEIGAGNGTLAMDVLNCLRDEYPDVYDRTRYHIIEISGSLVKLQQEKLLPEHTNVQITHKSIFHWEAREPSPCFFIAMEVIDNFPHDLIRYDVRTLEPYQCFVAVDPEGAFSEHYGKVTDPLIAEFLTLRAQLGHPSPLPRLLKHSATLRKAYASLPFAPSLSAAEFIPTRLLSLIQTLRDHFPRHRLLLSDFSSLPDTIPGVNAPVVQTRYRNTTVPCTTYLVKQGYFDIFFPTNFERLRDIYEQTLSQPSVVHSNPDPTRPLPLTTSASSLSLGSDFFSSHSPTTRRKPLDGVTSASGLPVGERKSSVFSHAEFLQTYADLEKTRLQSGENPMLEFYQNVKFLF